MDDVLHEDVKQVMEHYGDLNILLIRFHTFSGSNSFSLLLCPMLVNEDGIL